MTKIRTVNLLMLAVFFSGSCSTKITSEDAQQPVIDTTKLNNLNYTVEAAPQWTSLFLRKSGWFGGDGIFAITENGDERQGASKSSKTLIWFSDTMLGEIEGDSLQPGFKMINNSVAVLENGIPDPANIHFHWDSVNSQPIGLFIPKTPATEPGDYFWLGDGFVNPQLNNNTYIFGYRIRNTEPGAVFGFKEVGNVLIRIPAGSVIPFRDKQQIDIPFFLGKDVDSTGSFGAGLMVNTREAGAPYPDGYLYIYGVRGQAKNVMVARVLPQNLENFNEWRFWDGSGWNSDVSAIQTVTDRVSNELSVTPLADGRFAMIFQLDGLGKYVGMRLGASPVGPWGPPIQVYDVSGDLEPDKDIFPYNAKAHPVLSEPGELLISYNVNSFDFFNDVLTYPNLYRPRFIRLKYALD